MNFFKNTIIYKIVLISLFLVGIPAMTHAVSFSVVSDQDSLVVGNPFEVSFFIDTENEKINTVSGSVLYPKDILKIESINTGNSSVTFWVTLPSMDTNTGTVNFAGIIPGGIQTQKGLLFSLIITPTQEGNAEITVTNRDVLLHDGLGTPISSSVTPLIALVTPQGSKDIVPNQYKVNDKVKPEKFILYRTQSPYIFDNQWFITFASQDKISGIEKYILCESVLQKCTQTTSPHLLVNQSSWYMVRAYAYDYAGNTRMSMIVSQNIKITLFALVLLGILYISYVYVQKKRKK